VCRRANINFKVSTITQRFLRFQNFITTHFSKYRTQENKTRQTMYYNDILRRVRESLLPWKSNKYHSLVSGCICVRACVHVGTRARGRVHAHTCM
jgi:hypothetical protein